GVDLARRDRLRELRLARRDRLRELRLAALDRLLAGLQRLLAALELRHERERLLCGATVTGPLALDALGLRPHALVPCCQRRLALCDRRRALGEPCFELGQPRLGARLAHSDGL